jgi:aldehyde dehydrogenase (NAD+)
VVISIKPRRDAVGLSEGELLVGGAWRPAREGRTWSHLHPATGEEVGTFAVAGAVDVDEAVRTARHAFDEGPWPRTRAKERIRVLRRAADLIREHRDELAALQALDNGVPVAFGATAYPMSVECAADIFDHHAGWVDKVGGETLPGYQGGDHLVLTLREPVGVVAAVIPWNGPLLLAAQKLAPALAVGCTVVLKPSEYATFAALRLARLLEEAGLPPGVLGVVTGPGEPTGEALINHPLVDKVTFTGSRAVGRRVLVAAADGIKRVSLELGGKSPSIVFADANLEDAIPSSVWSIYYAAGQSCEARSRVLVEASVYDEFVSGFAARAEKVRVGDPLDQETQMGSLISPAHRERVHGFVERGRGAGAEVVAGGEPAEGKGSFYPPTVLAQVRSSMEVAQEEIFGPVVTVIPFEDEKDAIRVANDVRYGLFATVWTGDPARGHRVAARIKSGMVGINMPFTAFPGIPFGGYKQSGFGRELSIDTLDLYLETKGVLVSMSPKAFNPFGL